MVKRRLAVIVSPKLKRRDNLASVVPLSMTAPTSPEPWHVSIDLQLEHPWGPGTRWAKCDLISTVGYQRLDLPHYRHPVTNKRLYSQVEVEPGALDALRRAVACALGIRIE